jgi:hypothetical protein
VNFLDSDDGGSRLGEAYGDETYRRLAEVKAKYDPDNAFHHNQNIPTRMSQTVRPVRVRAWFAIRAIDFRNEGVR